MTTASIRPAQRTDIAPVIDLWVALVREQQPHGTTLLAEENRAVAHQWTAELIARDCLHIAVRDETVIGFVSYERQADRFKRSVTTGVIHNLMVQEGDRGNGVGSDLLAAAESVLASRGVDHIRLEAMADNEAADRFYRERGYSCHRRTYVKVATETDTHNTDGGKR